MKAAVTGATGLVGRHLVARLDAAVVLSRDPERARNILGGVEVLAWDPVTGPPPAEALAGVEVVFHLAGEPVAAGRWTRSRRRAIFASRVTGTKNLVAAIEELEPRPRVLVSASAVGYYGDRGDEELDERSPPGEGFLAEVCQAWEQQARAAERLGVRVVCARTGLVLAPEGGALGRLLPIFRKGLGGRLGSGRQWMPWIHLDDEIGLLLHAARDENLTGPLNLVSPNPVTNRRFTRTLAEVLGRSAFLPAPRFALRLALGKMSSALLSSQRVLPRRALESGYGFRYAELEKALRSCLEGKEGRETNER